LIAPRAAFMMAPMRPSFAALAMVCCALAPSGSAQEGLGGPQDPLAEAKPIAARPAAHIEPPPGGPALLFDVYQGLLAGSRGTRCPMDPSCSRYAREAIGAHGPLVGLALAADRLSRCGRDLEHYPSVRSIEGVARADSLR
jgi:hypothetical protein